MHRILMSLGSRWRLRPALAQVPAAELAKPPANARHFVIQSTGGKHGDSWSWIAADGTRMGRESMNLRGQVFELDSSGKAGADGSLGHHDPRRDAAGRRRRDLHRQRRHRAAGRARSTPAPRAYSTRRRSMSSQGGPIDTNAWFLERAAREPGQDARPAARRQGHAQQADRRSTVGSGATKQTIDAVGGHRPQHLAASRSGPTRNDKFFGLTVGIAWLPEAYAGEQAKHREGAGRRHGARRRRGLAKALVKVPAGPVAFTHVRTVRRRRACDSSPTRRSSSTTA